MASSCSLITSFLTALGRARRRTFRRFHTCLKAGERRIMRQVEMQGRNRDVAVIDRAHVGTPRRLGARSLEAEPVIGNAARILALDNARAVIVSVTLARDLDARDLERMNIRKIDVEKDAARPPGLHELRD